jgi:hypothetical protein
VLYAPANLEGVSRAPLHPAGQWPDRQVSIQMLEDFQARPLRVVAEQGIEVLQARVNPARRRPREVPVGVLLEHGQLDTQCLEPGFDRLKLGSHRERVAAGQEADEIPCFAFEAKDL